ncbi:MAG: PIN domain-containing protein [Deltaproteobacteria bacterium]|nr:PIN domain-containing protein [Deltaproteobacteria bacterium]
MIYLDTSAALAELLAEDRKPDPSIWSQPLVSSRLLECELWTRLHALKLAASHGDAARELLASVSLIALAPEVLARALEPFPLAVRTLDALHLASIEFLRGRRQQVTLASFDERQRAVAWRLGIPTLPAA